jgi:hypothetical protein
MGVSYDRPSATGRRYDSVDPGDELDPETPFLVVLSALARRKYAAKFKSVE